jgi:ankyrin repeat protein
LGRELVTFPFGGNAGACGVNRLVGGFTSHMSHTNHNETTGADDLPVGGNSINRQLVELACPSSRAIETILGQGANLNQPDPETGFMLFMEIINSIGAGDLITQCIKNGGKADPVDPKEASPLILAAMCHDYRSMAILLEEGANPNAVCFADENPQTALDVVYHEFHCTRRPADEKVCEAMEMILREFGGKTRSELMRQTD